MVPSIWSPHEGKGKFGMINCWAVRLIVMQFVFLLSYSASLFASEGVESEQDVSVTGELTIFQACDFENHRSKKFYQLEDKKNNKKYHLKFETEPAATSLETGVKVRVRGKGKGKDIYLAANGDGSVDTVEAATAPNAGDQHTIVFAINLIDKSLECSTSAIHSLMFSSTQQSVDGLYQENSNGNMGFYGDVVGPYNINYSSDTCDYSGWASAAESAAQAQGINISQYERKIYVFPKGTACGWAGLGTIGGSPSRSWIAHCNLPDVYAHELGHNVKMHHASTDTDNNGTADCEYCDTSDFMGYGGVGYRHNNAPHKNQMGWLPVNKILESPSDGTYYLAPLEADPVVTQYPQALKFAKPGTSSDYYFSYRQIAAGPHNNNMPSKYSDRISVHHYSSGSAKTYFIETLSDGQEFSDPISGLKVKMINHNNDYATVQVGSSPIVCTPASPTISVSPMSKSGSPGSALSYAITVINNDSPGCDSSTFNLTSVVPSGWSSGILSPSSIALQPGDSGLANLKVTSPVNTTDGNYSVAVWVKDSVDAQRSATKSVIYEVIAPTSCTVMAPTVSVSPSNQSAIAGSTLLYTASIKNNDNGEQCSSSTFNIDPILPAGWSGSLSADALALAPGGQGTITCTITSSGDALTGSYTIGVDVWDSAEIAHDRTAMATYSVTAPINEDTNPPSTPKGVKGAARRNKVQLSWRASTDDTAVADYIVLRDGQFLDTSTNTKYNDFNASTGRHTYVIKARDLAGNESDPSSPVSVNAR